MRGLGCHLGLWHTEGVNNPAVFLRFTTHQNWPLSARASSSSTWAPCWSRTRSSSSSTAGTAKCRAWTLCGTCRQPWLAACTPSTSRPGCEAGAALANRGGGSAGAVRLLHLPPSALSRHPLVLREGELASLCCCCCHRNNTVTRTPLPRPKHQLRVRGENPSRSDWHRPFHEHSAGLWRKRQLN